MNSIDLVDFKVKATGHHFLIRDNRPDPNEPLPGNQRRQGCLFRAHL